MLQTARLALEQLEVVIEPGAGAELAVQALVAPGLPQSDDQSHGDGKLPWSLIAGYVVGVVTLYAAVGYAVYRAVSALT